MNLPEMKQSGDLAAAPVQNDQFVPVVYTCGNCGRRVIIPHPKRVFAGRS